MTALTHGWGLKYILWYGQFLYWYSAESATLKQIVGRFFTANGSIFFFHGFLLILHHTFSKTDKPTQQLHNDPQPGSIKAYSDTHVIRYHYNSVIMSAMASEITGVSSAYLTVCSGADQRKHQSSASLTFVRGAHRWPVIPRTKG